MLQFDLALNKQIPEFIISSSTKATTNSQVKLITIHPNHQHYSGEQLLHRLPHERVIKA